MTYKKKVSLLLLFLLFYGGMLVLTLIAEDVHNARLPQVTAGRFTKEVFTYTVESEDGPVEKERSYLGIPKEMLDAGKVFEVCSKEEHGMIIYYVKKLAVSTCIENDAFYGSDDTLLGSCRVVLEGYETLEDGDEIYITNAGKK